MHSLVLFLMTIGSSNLVCEGGGEIVTTFPEVGSDSWTCISLGTAAFFLQCTLLIIRFSTSSVGDDSSSGTSSKTGSEAEGLGTGPMTLGGSMRKGSMIDLY